MVKLMLLALASYLAGPPAGGTKAEKPPVKPPPATAVSESVEAAAKDFEKDSRAALTKYIPVGASATTGARTVAVYGEVAYEHPGGSLQMTRKGWTVNFKGPATGKGKYARIQVSNVAVGSGIVVLEGQVERSEKPFK